MNDRDKQWIIAILVLMLFWIIEGIIVCIIGLGAPIGG